MMHKFIISKHGAFHSRRVRFDKMFQADKGSYAAKMIRNKNIHQEIEQSVLTTLGYRTGYELYS